MKPCAELPLECDVGVSPKLMQRVEVFANLASPGGDVFVS